MTGLQDWQSTEEYEFIPLLSGSTLLGLLPLLQGQPRQDRVPKGFQGTQPYLRLRGSEKFLPAQEFLHKLLFGAHSRIQQLENFLDGHRKPPRACARPFEQEQSILD